MSWTESRRKGDLLRPQVLIDGRPPRLAELEHAALVNYGHFTAMQVRGGAVRGLHLHLKRLREAHFELFGAVLDLDFVLQCARAAIASAPDSCLRITLFEMEKGSPRVMTAVRPPSEVSRSATRLMPVDFIRPFAHVKSTGSFAQIRYGEGAEHMGFDDALLITADGFVAETTMANVGFIAGGTIIWPTAPTLCGITRQLIEAAEPELGFRAFEAPVRLADVDRFDAAFVANSVGIAPIGAIAACNYATSNHVLHDVIDAYEAIPWDAI